MPDEGIPAEPFTAYVGRVGIVPNRTTDFQVMLLFSTGITKSKWATPINTLRFVKHFYDRNAPSEVLPELVQDHPERYGSMGLEDLGDEMFGFLKQYDSGAVLNEAYSTIPASNMTPRYAFQYMVSSEDSPQLSSSRPWADGTPSSPALSMKWKAPLILTTDEGITLCDIHN